MCFFSRFSHAEERFKFVEQVMFILLHSEIFHSSRSGHPLLFNNQTVLDCSNETKGVVDTYYSSGTISKLKHTLLLDQSRLDFPSIRIKLPVVSPKINCLKFSKRAISFWLKIIISSTSCQLFGHILLVFYFKQPIRVLEMAPVSYDFNLSPSYW